MDIKQDNGQDELFLSAIIEEFSKAMSRRSQWEGLWHDCYDYALPHRGISLSGSSENRRRGEHLFDATAPDAVDELASLLLGNLTPPLVPWFAVKAGTDLSEEEAQKITPVLDKATRIIQAHFDQSNFLVEVHQCFLDLVVAGTASLAFEEADPGAASAFRFTALPLQDVYLGEGDHGGLDQVFRPLSLTVPQILARYDGVELPLHILQDGYNSPDKIYHMVECVVPVGGQRGYRLCAFLVDDGGFVFSEKISSSPFINFRWMKSPGDVYGRSPVMKSLPDIKTANKVVELILKNASIAVTGIWQAEDDGVINPATIELVPGAIIPKALGSKGLTPLEMPARFDVSQLVLEDLRTRIRHALLVDRLPPVGGNKLTATEILERSGQMALLLGATFGRLQVEFLNPLLQQAYQILRRRGVVPDLPLDGRTLAIEYRSPLARAQAGQHVQSMMGWLQTASALGPEGLARVDRGAMVDYLARILGVPAALILPDTVDSQSNSTSNTQ
ncbi:MAG TPA: portal protein [Alphaproteobacteria bacterium]|nr:portal protein [Alphaproteobacteria bacterium]